MTDVTRFDHVVVTPYRFLSAGDRVRIISEERDGGYAVYVVENLNGETCKPLRCDIKSHKALEQELHDLNARATSIAKLVEPPEVKSYTISISSNGERLMQLSVPAGTNMYGNTTYRNRLSDACADSENVIAFLNLKDPSVEWGNMGITIYDSQYVIGDDDGTLLSLQHDGIDALRVICTPRSKLLSPKHCGRPSAVIRSHDVFKNASIELIENW